MFVSPDGVKLSKHLELDLGIVKFQPKLGQSEKMGC